MGFLQKLLGRVYDRLVDYLAKLIVIFIVIMTVTLGTIIYGFIFGLSDAWFYAVMGALCAVVFSFLGAVLLMRLTTIYRRHFLSDIQKQIVIYLGDISNGSARYKEILSHLGATNQDQGKIHLERVKLQWLGILRYKDGIVTLAERGWRVYDKLRSSK